MKLTELSERKIEIDGKDYTLFLNRKGITAWEKFTLKEQSNLIEMSSKYRNMIDEGVEITDETNPFEGIEDMESDFNTSDKMLEKLYWIMLYTHHKLNLNQVHDLFLKAKKEYGFDQLDLLAQQMIEDVNINPNADDEPKKLEALNPTN